MHFEDICIAHVAPVLVKLKGSGLVGVQPDSVAGGFAHLFALRIRQQCDGHGVGVLAQLTANQLGAAQHVAPLVIAAELHVAAVMLEHVVEVVGLHDHVVEFQEGQALFHALLVALGAQHVVHTETGTHFPQKFHVVQIQQPVGIVQHQGLSLAEVNKALHLTLKALGIVGDVLLGEHLAHVGAAAGVANHGGAAADEGNGLVSGHLQALHQRQSHKMAGSQAVRRAVKANIKGSFAVVDEFLDLLLVRDLRNEAAGFQFVINGHRFLLCVAARA